MPRNIDDYRVGLIDEDGLINPAVFDIVITDRHGLVGEDSLDT
jgi:hypothetical protein